MGLPRLVFSHPRPLIHFRTVLPISPPLQVSGLPTRCHQDSLLELWAVEGEFSQEADFAISRLTKKDILDKINGPAYRSGRNISLSLLGGERDSLIYIPCPFWEVFPKNDFNM